MDAAAEIGRNLASKISRHRFSRNERADAERDGRTRVERSILRREREEGKFTFLIQLTTSRIGNPTRSIHTLLLYVMMTIVYSLVPTVLLLTAH